MDRRTHPHNLILALALRHVGRCKIGAACSCASIRPGPTFCIPIDADLGYRLRESPTNIWRKATSPARGFRRLTSDRHRGRNSSARRQLERPVTGSALPVVHRPLAAQTARNDWMRTIIGTSIVAMAVACCASAYGQTLTGTARITDADTIVIGSERIRFQGVDAPETDQICLDRKGAVWKCGIDARDRLIQYIGARKTSCVTNGKKDVFGRWLATCSTSEGDLSAWLVREGLGMAFIRYSKAYIAEEATAGARSKGCGRAHSLHHGTGAARTANTAILGPYKPTKIQERILLPSTRNCSRSRRYLRDRRCKTEELSA